MKVPKDIAGFLAGYEEPTAALALDLRQHLLSRFPGLTEETDAPASLIGYRFGPGYKNTIFAILLSKKGVKLGFNRGAELPDPERLLTGNGKVHRLVEIRSRADLDHPALEILLQEALLAWKVRTHQL